MKKYIFAFLLWMSATQVQGWHLTSEFKVGVFSPTSTILRDLYRDGWANYQLEFTYTPFSCENPCWWKQFFLFAAGNYIYQKGESDGEDTETDIEIFPATLGIKYIYPTPWKIDFYASGGARYFFLNIDNKDEGIVRRDRARGLGGVFSIGSLIHVYPFVLLDLFIDYSFRNFSKNDFYDTEVERTAGIDIAGWTAGIGLGYKF